MWTVAIIIALLLGAGAVLLVICGSSCWAHGTRTLRARLVPADAASGFRAVDFRELGKLPAPVQRYLRKVLVNGAPVVTGVRVYHEGEFNVSQAAAQWKRFSSDEQVTTQPPGFDWDARMRMAPGLPVRVHDAYVAGEGLLHAALFGLIPLVRVRGTGDIAEGELMRFLGESAWYPTALLPGQGIRWTAVDAQSARAALTDGNVSVELLFRFNGQDLIESVQADARGRMVGKQVVPTQWQGRFWGYEERGGMLVPLRGEVAWLLPEGGKPYWRGRIVSIEYQFAD